MRPVGIVQFAKPGCNQSITYDHSNLGPSTLQKLSEQVISPITPQNVFCNVAKELAWNRPSSAHPHSAGMSCRAVKMLQDQRDADRAALRTKKKKQKKPEATIPSGSPEPEDDGRYRVVVVEPVDVSAVADDESPRSGTPMRPMTSTTLHTHSVDIRVVCSRLPNLNMHEPFLRKVMNANINMCELKDDEAKREKPHAVPDRKEFLGFQNVSRFRHAYQESVSVADVPTTRVLRAMLDSRAARLVRWGMNKRSVMRKPAHLV